MRESSIIANFFVREGEVSGTAGFVIPMRLEDP